MWQEGEVDVLGVAGGRGGCIRCGRRDVLGHKGWTEQSLHHSTQI